MPLSATRVAGYQVEPHCWRLARRSWSLATFIPTNGFNPVQHRTVRGKIRYLSKKPDSFNELRGTETFKFTHHADGRVVLRASCECELPEPKLLRDVLCAYDSDGRVEDAYVRIMKADCFLGAGWYRRDGDFLEMEAWSPENGRVSLREASDRTFEDLGLHPVIGDGYMCRHVDPHNGPRQRRVKFQFCSPDHRGATPPTIAPLEAIIEYVGDETVTVAAGTFATHHYRYLDASAATPDKAHPPIDVWVTADGDCVYVKGRIGGYFMSEYELVEYQNVLPAG